MEVFMKYENKYPMDENIRVLLCPRCDNEEFSENAVFCRICGEKLFNHCDGGEWNDWLKEYEPHKNYGNARFRETCGKPTYFSKNGYLVDFEEVKQNKKQQLKVVGNVIKYSEESNEELLYNKGEK